MIFRRLSPRFALFFQAEDFAFEKIKAAPELPDQPFGLNGTHNEPNSDSEGNPQNEENNENNATFVHNFAVPKTNGPGQCLRNISVTQAVIKMPKTPFALE